MLVPQATRATPGYDHSMTVRVDITHDFTGLVIPDDRPERNRHDAIFPIAAVATGTLTRSSIFRTKVRPWGQGDQRVQGPITGQDHVPAFATVATVWTTKGAILLTAHADAAMAALSGANEDLGFVDEHGLAPVSSNPQQGIVRQPADRAGRSIAS